MGEEEAVGMRMVHNRESCTPLLQRQRNETGRKELSEGKCGESVIIGSQKTRLGSQGLQTRNVHVDSDLPPKRKGKPRK